MVEGMAVPMKMDRATRMAVLEWDKHHRPRLDAYNISLLVRHWLYARLAYSKLLSEKWRWYFADRACRSYGSIFVIYQPSRG